MAEVQCLTCIWERETGNSVDRSRSQSKWAKEVGVSEKSIRRHLQHSEHVGISDRFAEGGLTGESETHRPDGSADYVFPSAVAWGYEDFRGFIRSRGQDPDAVTFSWGVTSNPGGGYWNKLLNVRPISADSDGPEWPVIQAASPVEVNARAPLVKPARNNLMLSLKCADTQIGFRALPDGTFEAFHDDRAMAVFAEVCRQEQPDSIIILGDLLDLPSQGKYVQEAGFARTTQMALDACHTWLATLRAVSPDSKIVIIEGNHDKRMQNFIEQNALAAFGLKQANMPDSWPVMSLPNLLRLDDLNIQYQDAYPVAAYWDDEGTRNIHGTRANSRGSTTSQYSQELPHISTWAGHSHRAEITYKTVIGNNGDRLETYTANPGCLCRTDGAVPSVHGALHSDGSSAWLVEDWQQGFGSLLYGAGEAWPQVWRIHSGRALYRGQIIEAP